MDYNRIFFTADHHFSHQNSRGTGIIDYCKRPFKTIEEHDEVLIRNWNRTVGKHDQVWYLGDFMFGRDIEKISKRLKELNGTKFLIPGNHDREVKKAVGWSKIFKSSHKLIMNQYRISLSHKFCFPTDCDIYLYAHSHGNGVKSENRNIIDVGVDNWNYSPISLQQILEIVYD